MVYRPFGNAIGALGFAMLASSLGAGCAYDWKVGEGSGGAATSGSNTTGTSTSGAGSTSAMSTASGASCAELEMQYRAALLDAKRCVMTDTTGCQTADTDACNCQVFLDHASTMASTFDAKKATFVASACNLGCTTCPVGPVIGSCDVDIANGGTSCVP